MRLPPHQQPRVGFGLVKKLIKISVHASNSFYLNLLAMDAKTDQEYQQLLKEDEYSSVKCRIQQRCWPLPLLLLPLLNLTMFLNLLTNVLEFSNHLINFHIGQVFQWAVVFFRCYFMEQHHMRLFAQAFEILCWQFFLIQV